jgi:bacillithiol biosynthesis deacetylase BshB1
MATIMAIGAHPDDLEIGGGGLLRALGRRGHRVVGVDLTDGEPTPRGNREIRAAETARANAALGLAERLCLELPNRVLADGEEPRRRLAAAMRHVRPEVVLTHTAEDCHPDHVAAAAITRGAVLLSRVVKIDLPHEPFRPGPVYAYLCSHLKQAFRPTFLIPLAEEDFEAKLAALRAYESQFAQHEPNRGVIEMLANRMRYWGGLAGAPYAEAFVAEEAVSVPTLPALL